jgi:NAD(P)-dependent dehydrogenase (short-subunit alcohol dehydrogenase family)
MSDPLARTGRRALVLGAGASIGASVAVALAEAGADVAVASASIEGAEVMAVRRARRQIAALGRRTAEYAFDVTLGQNVQVSTRQVAKEMGGLDVLVYAVDHRLGKPIEQTSDADWARTLAVNLSGAFYACRAAVREMRARGWGRIVLVAPGFGRDEAAGAVAYVAARHGLTGLARSLAHESGAHGVGVNAIVPAWLDVSPLELSGDSGFATRRHIRPSEVAPLVVHLCSEDGGSITGQVYVVEG